MPSIDLPGLRRRWGNAVRERRTELGLSLTDLARECDSSAPRMRQIENGQCGTGDELRIKVAEALRVEVEDLFTYPDTTAAAS